MTVKVAEEWLNSCSGCEISIVDLGERLLDVLELVQFVHSPVLMDHKYFGQLGNGRHLEVPEAAVGIVSGGVRNEEHREVLQLVRQQCQIVVALGTCATHGGIPALSNSYHGVYWALLLGKRVLCVPFSRKFHHYRMPPGYAGPQDWMNRLSQARRQDEMLGVCREATARFEKRVRALLEGAHASRAGA